MLRKESIIAALDPAAVRLPELAGLRHVRRDCIGLGVSNSQCHQVGSFSPRHYEKSL